MNHTHCQNLNVNTGNNNDSIMPWQKDTQTQLQTQNTSTAQGGTDYLSVNYKNNDSPMIDTEQPYFNNCNNNNINHQQTLKMVENNINHWSPQLSFYPDIPPPILCNDNIIGNNNDNNNCNGNDINNDNNNGNNNYNNDNNHKINDHSNLQCANNLMTKSNNQCLFNYNVNDQKIQDLNNFNSNNRNYHEQCHNFGTKSVATQNNKLNIVLNNNDNNNNNNNNNGNNNNNNVCNQKQQETIQSLETNIEQIEDETMDIASNNNSSKNKKKGKKKRKTIQRSLEPGHLPCNVCGKMFKHRGNLLVHMKLHNGKAHSCQHCGKKFARKSNCMVSHVSK